MFSLTFTTKCQDLHHQGPPPPSPPPTVAPDPLPFPSPHNAARGASASISWFRFYGSNPNDFYDYGGPYKGGPYNGRSAALVRIVHRGFYGPRLRWPLGAVGRSVGARGSAGRRVQGRDRRRPNARGRREAPGWGGFEEGKTRGRELYSSLYSEGKKDI